MERRGFIGSMLSVVGLGASPITFPSPNPCAMCGSLEHHEKVATLRTRYRYDLFAGYQDGETMWCPRNPVDWRAYTNLSQPWTCAKCGGYSGERPDWCDYCAACAGKA